MFPSLLKRREYTVSECPFSSVSNVPSARSQTRIRLSTPKTRIAHQKGPILFSNTQIAWNINHKNITISRVHICKLFHSSSRDNTYTHTNFDFVSRVEGVKVLQYCTSVKSRFTDSNNVMGLK